MTRQQEIRNSLLDGILMLTAAADQLAALHARIHEQRVQILQRLRRLAFLRHQVVWFRRWGWEGGEAELEIDMLIRVVFEMAVGKVWWVNVLLVKWFSELPSSISAACSGWAKGWFRLRLVPVRLLWGEGGRRPGWFCRFCARSRGSWGWGVSWLADVEVLFVWIFLRYRFRFSGPVYIFLVFFPCLIEIIAGWFYKVMIPFWYIPLPPPKLLQAGEWASSLRQDFRHAI